MAMEYRYMRKAAPTVDDNGNLTGRAWPYGSETRIGSGPYGFTEKIRTGAGKKSINDGDIVLLDNHETRLPLARMSANTLQMRDGTQGGDWVAQPADTSYARDVVENVRAKNYGGCSFGFEIVKDEWTMDDGSPATPLDGTRREIIEMKVHEISVCTFPAYTQTSVSTKEMVRAARGLSPEDERKVSATAYNGKEGEGERAAAASYEDLSTCGDCGATGQYSTYCTACGKPMTTPASSNTYCGSCGAKMDDGTRACTVCGEVRAEEDRGGDAPGDGAKPYGNVDYADPGYQSDKKKRYPLDTKKHAKAAWAYISKAKNAGAYTASQLASVKSKIKAALTKYGVTTSPSEAKMVEWEAGSDFREMVEGWETMARNGEFGVLPGDVARADDVNTLARDIRAAQGQEDRLACITRAAEWGLSDLLPDHWGGDGNVAKAATEEVTRDMDSIYSLALSLPATNTALRIMDLAEAYLTQEAAEEAKRTAEEPVPDDPDRPATTLADARRAMEEAENRRRSLAH
jgi:HK97 family phage prohead protease